ncbi:hypothetical protein AYO21_06694 [Fonsecaea monophora]|uniref:BZIP domain-containing protein n=1 Tax=Fonsecaea monophora TaxID=254056 RepID=A0A177F4H3_9EURO|nr:hypothetical protein AYO21_06694 [Fonsecaea monophora]OAG39143.1 hypothetical protein AYO21_06694 [Fonsecaea monophora]
MATKKAPSTTRTQTDERRYAALIPITVRPNVSLYQAYGLLCRKFRNRLSQKSFRERQHTYVKELEQHIMNLSAQDGGQYTLLSAENRRLRSKLLDIRNRMTSTSNALNRLAAEIGEVLEINNSASPEGTQDGIQDLSYNPGLVAAGSTAVDDMIEWAAPIVPNDSVVPYEEPAIEPPPPPPPSQDVVNNQSFSWVGDLSQSQSAPNNDAATLVCPPLVNRDTNSLSELTPDLFNSPLPWSTLAGNQQHPSFASRCSPINFSLSPMLPKLLSEGLRPSRTNSLNAGLASANLPCASRFAEHMESMECVLRQQLDVSKGKALTFSKVSEASIAFLSVFVNYLWPGTSIMWLNSYLAQTADRILAWRMSPNLVTYNRLLPEYMPSAYEMETPHCAVIGWFPHAPLREKLIRLYDNSRHLDQIWVDTLYHTVVEVPDMSQILSDAEPGPGFLGVWKIFDTISAAPELVAHALGMQNSGMTEMSRTLRSILQEKPNPANVFRLSGLVSDGDGWTPVPLGALLQSPKLALKAYYHLKMYDSPWAWKWDPAFFEKYPELTWDGYKAVVARGKSYRQDCYMPSPCVDNLTCGAMLGVYRQVLGTLQS